MHGNRILRCVVVLWIGSLAMIAHGDDICNQPTIDLCGIAVYFNPASYQLKKPNWDRFRKSSLEQGLWLLAVELVFDGAPGELQENKDADALIQLRTDSKFSILWQKERLLNIAINALPSGMCKNIAWLDGEVLFSNENWIKETVHSLETYQIVQPFTYVLRLPENVMWQDPTRTTVSLKKDDGVRTPSFTRTIALNGLNKLNNPKLHGYCGFGWAARATLLSQILLYDHAIVGGADTLMAHAFFGHLANDTTGYTPYFYEKRLSNPKTPLGQSFRQWSDHAFSKVGGKVGFISGTLLHIWHGSKRNRQYEARHELLRDFDPTLDLESEPCNVIFVSSLLNFEHKSCYIWSLNTTQSTRHEHFVKFFRDRQEDGQK